MDTRKRIAGSERELSGLWARSAGRSLRTEGGLDVDVLYPGRCPGSAGPDYRDAVLAFGSREVVRGDVELHVTAGDWRRHGHGGDPAYSQVVLHAVSHPDGTTSTAVPGGGEAPVLVLAPARPRRGLPCKDAFQRLPDETLAVLRSAGTERLRARAVRMAQECSLSGPRVVLCRAAARALGYAANADAGRQLGGLLAGDAAWSLLQSGDAPQRLGHLLGMAGLLPSQRSLAPGVCDGPEVEALEASWRDSAGSLPSMSPDSWSLHGVYVNNSPVRRVVALADLAPRLEPLTGAARSRLSDPASAGRLSAAALETLFVVSGDAYWRCRYDFGGRTRESDLLGASKAREVVVNALLPFLLAVAMLEQDETLFRGVVGMFVEYPGSRANSVTRHMRAQLGIAAGRCRAAVDQGMLHVYAEYCRHALCCACPLRAGRPAP
ncbi:MAG: DUF2851 family protein [Dehalococcoidia bacterium]|jgi:hypothetical protein|nr:DUF2851 family protein [Dehalococcoidia bacterium]